MPLQGKTAATLEFRKGTIPAFIVLPAEASERPPRQRRTRVEGRINTYLFQATLEPKGQLSHWLLVTAELLQAAGASIDEIATLDIMSVAQEPEPEILSDIEKALAANPEDLE
ncbi:MAG: DUF1905 domain-containing protein [Candidatus Thiodiazotropha sp.]